MVNLVMSNLNLDQSIIVKKNCNECWGAPASQLRRKIHTEYCYIEQDLDCNYIFPITLTLIGIAGAKSIGKM